MSDPIIEFVGVNKWFGHSHVLKDINLRIDAGEVVVICGPSGSGKSTLLRCVNGLETIQKGTVRVMSSIVGDKMLSSSSFRSNIGLVFQKFSLYPHMSVLDNLTLAPRKVKRLAKPVAEERARRLLDRVGILEKAQAYPHQLSGGQQQRAAIARALIMEPKIMLFDEPTSALDPEMIREVLDVMRDLARTGMTMLTVTHEMDFAHDVARRVIFMDRGEIAEDAAASEFFSRPRTNRAARFLDTVSHH